MSKIIEMSKSAFASEVFNFIAEDDNSKRGELSETFKAIKSGKAKVETVRELSMGDSRQQSLIIIVIIWDDLIIIIVIG